MSADTEAGDPAMNVKDMTIEQLLDADIAMMATVAPSGPRSLTPEHCAVKAELGRRTAEERTRRTRSKAGRKGAATRARRKSAGLPPKRREFSLDNAPAGGWTDADRVG